MPGKRRSAVKSSYSLESHLNETGYTLSFDNLIALRPLEKEIFCGYMQAPEKTLLQLAFLKLLPGALSPSVMFLHVTARIFVERIIAEKAQELPGKLPDESIAKIKAAANELAKSTENADIEACVSDAWIARMYDDFCAVVASEAGEADMRTYIANKHAAVNSLGRIYMHLVETGAENPNSLPFLLLATYESENQDTKQQLTLKAAIAENRNNRELVKNVVGELKAVAKRSDLMRELLLSRRIFEPAYLSADEAYTFLTEVELYIALGINCRIPNWWHKRQKRFGVSVTVGDERKKVLSSKELMSFSAELTLDGEKLTEAEIQKLLTRERGLTLIKGKWVEVDIGKLTATLDAYERAKQLSLNSRLSFKDALRMQLTDGASLVGDETVNVEVGEHMRAMIDAMCNFGGRLPVPENIGSSKIDTLLRPYQREGVEWLYFMYNLELGACLSDDMGLGKTIQVLAFLCKLRNTRNSTNSGENREDSGVGIRGGAICENSGAGTREDSRGANREDSGVGIRGGANHEDLGAGTRGGANPDGANCDEAKCENRGAKRASLLVVPASLVQNWANEIEKFAPELKYCILHTGSFKGAENKVVQSNAAQNLCAGDVDLYITTYAMAVRKTWLSEVEFETVILDEAQAIKNPATRQAIAVKKLSARFRICMTGTPIENRPTDLYSLFDFLNPGLLGSPREFASKAAHIYEDEAKAEKLKKTLSPFILRREKTDRSIITDLPEKIEMKSYCMLTSTQTVLYESVIDKLKESIDGARGMERRGLVLSCITRLKQICNHPDQYLSGSAFSPRESGKFMRLFELCESIRDANERVIVFTQFKELCKPLCEYLTEVFGAQGLMLHGSTPIKQRGIDVDRFNSDEYVPFMVLSLKAGGVGLNLTAANHVIHFDRWWNPAVEDQATDRVFRIGQPRNVLVHKLITKGTLEEKIDSLIESKRSMFDSLIGSSAAPGITEMKSDEIIELLRLS